MDWPSDYGLWLSHTLQQWCWGSPEFFSQLEREFWKLLERLVSTDANEDLNEKTPISIEEHHTCALLHQRRFRYSKERCLLWAITERNFHRLVVGGALFDQRAYHKVSWILSRRQRTSNQIVVSNKLRNCLLHLHKKIGSDRLPFLACCYCICSQGNRALVTKFSKGRPRDPAVTQQRKLMTLGRHQKCL